jgi:riboflavin kinase/FMN adenylyltransferase
MSTMTFHSKQIQGKGIGKKDIVPTINLAIPSSFDLQFGVYSARITLRYRLGTKKHNTALHFGPRPTDQDLSPSLELHVLDAQELDTDYNAEDIEVEIVRHIRDIREFDDFAQLRDQIQKDIVEIREVLG